MLGKLLKHEFIATKRIYLPIYFVTIVLALIVNGFFALQSRFFDDDSSFSVISTLFIVFFTAMFVLVLLCCLMSGPVISLYRFYKNVFTDEGYLTNTLPVKPISILVSKLITGIVWYIAGIIIFVLSIFLMDFDLLKEIVENIDVSVVIDFLSDNLLLITALAVFSLISLIMTLSMAYMSVAIGNFARNHKVALSLLIYFASITIFEIVASVSLVITNENWDSNLTVFANHSTFTISHTYSAIIFIYAGVLLVVSALELFFTHFIMSRRLNLS